MKPMMFCVPPEAVKIELPANFEVLRKWKAFFVAVESCESGYALEVSNMVNPVASRENIRRYANKLRVEIITARRGGKLWVYPKSSEVPKVTAKPPDFSYRLAMLEEIHGSQGGRK